MLRIGTMLQERYEILEKIGSGGMSDVYKAECHKLRRLVAIKVLKEEFSEDADFVGKFKMEAQAAARLSHPNIVNVYDVVDEGNLHYIVMELIEGITLKSYIAAKGHLGAKESIGIAIQAASGMAAAHEQGIIHRDIKPQNMIISKDGKVKVMDFGIARAVSSQTMTSSAMGSVHYISPEQARGGYSDIRSDIYSLGVTMYEMVTGHVPFEGDNTVTVALAHLQDPAPPPSYYNRDIPPSLEKIILKCMEKKPERRYYTANDLIGDLRKALVNPMDDFVEVTPAVDNSQTVIIGSPELAQIREGRRPVEESRYDAQERRTPPPSAMNQTGQRGGHSVAGGGWSGPDMAGGSGGVRGTAGGGGRSTAGSGGRSSGGHDGRRAREQEDDISPNIERIITAAGIVAAIIIVVVLVVVIARFSGIFRSGSGKKESPTAVESLTEEETTLSEKQVLMPDVLGITEDLARKKLSSQEFYLDMKIAGYEYSDIYEKDTVMEQKTPEGAVVDKYSSVSVVISKGPEHPEIDLAALGLETMDGEAARKLLEERKLTVHMQTQNSETVEKGRLISFSPAKAREGDSVTLMVSDGPVVETLPMTEVPQVSGQTVEIAGEMLADAGLELGSTTEEHSEEISQGLVISQDVQAGSQTEQGTKVNLVVSSGPEEKPYKYLAAIETSYPLQNFIGPGSSSTKLTVKLRLKQVVNGKEEARDLIEPVTVTGDYVLPIAFKNIEGAYGVTTGQLEVINVDTGAVLNSYPLTFIAVPQ